MAATQSMAAVGGGWLPVGASHASAARFVKNISATMSAVTPPETTADRVTITCRGTGRAAMRSTSPSSTSPASSLAR